MNPSLATLLYALGILALFYLNRDKSAHTSRALWIPVIWFWILGSRSVSVWLGWAPAQTTFDQMMDGSPTDRLVFLVLLISGSAILVGRGHRPASVMAANWPIVLYFLYCLMSVAWSDYPDVAIKRWIKATGDVVMALIVVTDPQPVAALRRLFSRLGFVLIPASVLLIKYYPYLGSTYDMWSGDRFNTGVTTNKNILGISTFVLAVGALWQVFRLWKDPILPDRSRQLVAQCTQLGFGIWLLSAANSATSTFCFILAALLMLLTGLRRIRGRPAAVHTLVLTLVLLGALIKLTGADVAVVEAMGRNADLTGRASDIWPLLIPMAPNALVGAGFESFWLGPRLLGLWNAFPNLYLNEAHNGYLEVYLNLGAIGVSLIILMLVHGYRRSVDGIRIDPSSASLMMAYVLSAVMYSYTEAGFRPLSLAWSFLLLAIIWASRISELTAETQLNSAPSESVRWSTTGFRTSSTPNR